MRLIKVDALALQDHYYLTNDDSCYFFGEYTAGEKGAYSTTNQLILNFKKGVNTKGTAQWWYKERAIEKAAQMLREAIKEDQLPNITFVPIPPSKSKTDPLYDDRLVRMLGETLHGVPNGGDVRELVLQKQSAAPSHSAAHRPGPEELAMNYEVDKRLIAPRPTQILVVDDVLTTGSHYKAVHMVLRRYFPDAPITGVFLARRVPKSVDFDAV